MHMHSVHVTPQPVNYITWPCEHVITARREPPPSHGGQLLN